MTKIEKQLEQVRNDLDAIRQKLTTLDAEKAAALRTSSDYAKWRSAHEGAEQERERLELLVEKLSVDLEQEKADTARADLASRRAELEQQSAALAKRIAEQGAAAAAVLVGLAEEARANASSVEQFNREISDDDVPLLSGDHLARHRNPAPREDLDETIVDLWVYESSGELVSDPDAVVERSYERGFIPGTEVSRHPTHVVRKRFRQIRYLEPGDREHVEPLASVLRLPNFGAPGMCFDRGRAVEPAQRRELVELIPAPDAPAKPAIVEAT